MRIEIRTTPEEKQRWQTIAENKGVSLSELVRSCLGGQRLRKRRDPPKVDPDLLRELARIGNNLNQIARQVNAGGGTGHDRVQVVAALMAIDAGLERLRHAVLEKGADDDR